MARLCLTACGGIVIVGLAVFGFGLTNGADKIMTAGGTVISAVGLVPFRTYYIHEQNRAILVQVKAALMRGADLSDFTQNQVNVIFAGKTQ
jgi:hypothetical protein